MAGLAMRATARRWRGLGVGVGLGCGLGRWPGGLRQQENIAEVAQRLARGMPQALIADLVEAGRQDVLIADKKAGHVSVRGNVAMMDPDASLPQQPSPIAMRMRRSRALRRWGETTITLDVGPI